MAKWMIAAVGAVASLLVAGVQLTSIGKVSTTRAVVAGAMVLVLISAAAAAIMKLSAVLLPEITTREDVVARAQSGEFATFLSKHAFLLDGRQNAAALASAQRAAAQKGSASGATEAQKVEARRLTNALNSLVPFGSYFTVRANFTTARRWTLVAAVIGGLAIVGFARSVGAGPSDSSAASVPTVTPTPVAVTMRLSSAGVEAFRSSIGRACAMQLAGPATAANALVTHASEDDVTVIVIPRGECRLAAQITLTADLGQVAADRVVLPAKP